MFIELVDSLRCLESHDETWLVASVTRMDARDIVEGTLGCPICRREYPIRGRVGWFTSGGRTPTEHLTPLRPTAAGDRLVRAAALLGLSDGGGIVVLGGSWTDVANQLPASGGVGHVVVLNVTPADDSPQEVSAIVVDDELPFRHGALRGVALGGDTATPSLASSAATVLRSKGRLVAPSSVAVPAAITELARDTSDWVGERTVLASPPITLRSARR